MVILGQEFAGYIIVASLDSPAPAEAYRALDAEGREVTLYVQEDLVVGADTFRAELKRLLSLTPVLHDIVPVLRGGMEGRAGWIAARASDEPSIEELLPRLRPWAYDLLVDVAGALGPAHAVGLSHGDLGPHTVVLTGKGAVLLRAFGLHRLFGAPVDAVADAARYRAPEIFDARIIDHRTDVYGLGMLLYCALSGRPPFEGRDDLDVCVLEEELAPLPGVPAAVNEALARALAKDPDARFQTVQAFMSAVRPLLLADSAPSGPLGAPSSPSPELSPDTERNAPASMPRDTLPTGTAPPQAVRHPVIEIADPGRRRRVVQAGGALLAVVLASAAVAVPLSSYVAQRRTSAAASVSNQSYNGYAPRDIVLVPPVQCDPAAPAAAQPGAVEEPVLESQTAARRPAPASLSAPRASHADGSARQRWYGDQLF
ncbi:protein kinase [Sorangium cellulosum]|uniref:Protein kinase n=1 Tax=Sorangium cellulosum TaxID=56 RepID=A0A2L0F7C6_SORCE|nr:protein kinase [Sorangium cellulosum]AUX47475.1 protein kinase [Sorangium cellulosum]